MYSGSRPFALFASLLLLPSIVLAQDGMPDPSFSGVAPIGRRAIAFDRPGGSLRDTPNAVFRRGGNYIVVGRASPDTADATVVAAIAVVDLAGNVVARHVVPTPLIADAALDAGGFGLRVGMDGVGRVYLAGIARVEKDGDATARFGVLRLATTFAVDGTYGDAGLATIDVRAGAGAEGGQPLDLAVAADGSTALVGRSPRLDLTNALTVARLTPTGAPDTLFAGDGTTEVSFNTVLAPNALGNRIALDGQDRVVVAGIAIRDANGQAAVIARLRRDGTLDPTFSPDASTCDSPVIGGRRFIAFGAPDTNQDVVESLAPRADGGIDVLASSTRRDATQSFQRCVVARLRADGGVDTAFATLGQRLIDFPDDDCRGRRLLRQRDGKPIVVRTRRRIAGNTLVAEMFALRLTADGAFDGDFATDPLLVPTALVPLGFPAGAFNEAEATEAMLDGERVVAVGWRRVAGAAFDTIDDLDFVVARLRGVDVFADGVEARRVGN